MLSGCLYLIYSNGILGIGSSSSTPPTSPVPVLVTGALNGYTISSISVGNNFVLLLSTDGNVFGCGSNYYGQLGVPDIQRSNVFVKSNISEIGAKTVIAVASAGYTTMILTSDGYVYSFGYNGNGQYGLGTTFFTKNAVPVLMPGIVNATNIWGADQAYNSFITIGELLTTSAPTVPPTETATTTMIPSSTAEQSTSEAPTPTSTTATPTETPTQPSTTTTVPTTTPIATAITSTTSTSTFTTSQPSTTATPSTTSMASTTSAPTTTTLAASTTAIATTTEVPQTTSAASTTAAPTTATPTSTTTELPTSTVTATPTSTNALTTDNPTSTLATTPTLTTTVLPTSTVSIAPTSTNVLTTNAPTYASTTTATPTLTRCYGIPSIFTNVCSGKGSCVSTDDCVCFKASIIGSQCETEITDVSKSYYSFNTTVQVNTDVSNAVSASTGLLTYTITNQTMRISSGGSVTSKKSLCFDGSDTLPGKQAYIAFSYPDTLPSGVITDITMQPKDGTMPISAGLKFSGSTQLHTIQTLEVSAFTAVTLKPQTMYLLLLSVDSDLRSISSQIVNRKNVTLSSVTTAITSTGLSNSLLTKQYYICVTMSSATRSIHADTSMDINYYGFQTTGSVGTLKNQVGLSQSATVTTSSVAWSGMIFGAVFGSLAGCILLSAVIVAVVLVTVAAVKKHKTKSTESMTC